MFASIAFCQTRNSKEYEEGMQALMKGDSTSAEISFLQSADIYKDAASFYRLGQIYSSKNKPSSKSKSSRYYGEAVRREKGNIEYRLAYANQLAKNKDSDAIEEFEKILIDFPANLESRIMLADYYANQFFNTLLNRNRWDLDEQKIKSEEYYKKAEELFGSVLTKERSNRQALFGLAELYFKSKNYEKSSSLLRDYCAINDTAKRAFLMLGIIHNSQGELRQAKSSFLKAFDLMTGEERNDYIYNSAVDLLKPKFLIDEHYDSRTEIEELIKRFWEICSANPEGEIYEREIEHYARVAYANLFLSESALKSYGRKTAKGEVYMRYGNPDTVYLYNGKYAADRIQNWSYTDFTLGFGFANGRNFHIDEDFFDWKKKNEIQRYSPFRNKVRFFYDFYSFEPLGNNERGELEAYFVFSYPEYINSFNYRFLITDSELNKLTEGGGGISRLNAQMGTGCIQAILPQSFGHLTVNLNNGADTGLNVFADYDNREIENKLRISDIILASHIDSGRVIPGAVKRNTISIVPSLKRIFLNNSPLYVYFEINRMNKGNESHYFYEKTVNIIKKKNEEGEGLIDKIIDYFSKDKENVSATSVEKTEKNPQQIFFTIDNKNLEPGEYDLLIKIKDRISGQESEKRATFKIAEI